MWLRNRCMRVVYSRNEASALSKVEESHSRQASKYCFSSFIPDKVMRSKLKESFGKQHVFKVLKNYLLNWISSTFLRCWVSMCSVLCVLWVRNNSAGWTWVILGWYCVLHPEKPTTVYTCVFTVSWWWRSLQWFCIADTKNNSILPWTQVLYKISDSHFFPSLKKSKITTCESLDLLLSRCLGWERVKVTKGWVCCSLHAALAHQGQGAVSSSGSAPDRVQRAQAAITAIPFELTAVALALVLTCLQVSETEV